MTFWMKGHQIVVGLVPDNYSFDVVLKNPTSFPRDDASEGIGGLVQCPYCGLDGFLFLVPASDGDEFPIFCEAEQRTSTLRVRRN